MLTSFLIWWSVGWIIATTAAYMANEMDGMNPLEAFFILILTVIIWPMIIAAWMADVSNQLKAIKRNNQ